MKGFQNPSFMQAIAEFQTNPDEAKKKYANNKEVQEFMSNFCQIMGRNCAD